MSEKITIENKELLVEAVVQAIVEKAMKDGKVVVVSGESLDLDAQLELAKKRLELARIEEETQRTLLLAHKARCALPRAGRDQGPHGANPAQQGARPVHTRSVNREYQGKKSFPGSRPLPDQSVIRQAPLTQHIAGLEKVVPIGTTKTDPSQPTA